jgi:hypothetical protein
MRTVRFLMSCATMFIIASCAEQPLPLHPLIDGSVDSVSRKDIAQAIAVAQQYRVDDHGSPLRVYRVHVIDHNHLDVCFRPPRITEACDRLERTKEKWQLSGEHSIIAPNVPLS